MLGLSVFAGGESTSAMKGELGGSAGLPVRFSLFCGSNACFVGDWYFDFVSTVSGAIRFVSDGASGDNGVAISVLVQLIDNYWKSDGAARKKP